MRMIGRFAESEDPVLFARFDEVDKCEFIKANAPEEAWEAWTSSDDDGAGLLVKGDALREQAREVLVSAARSRTSSLPQPAPSLVSASALRAVSNNCRRKSSPSLLAHHRRPSLRPPPVGLGGRSRTDVTDNFQRTPALPPPLALFRGKACGLRRRRSVRR